MSVKEPSGPTPPPPLITPDQERAATPSNSLSDASVINPPPAKKTGSKKRSKRETSKQAGAAEPVDPPARQRARCEPYRRAEPTPEREAALPADPEELKTLDATAKTRYKSDREVLEYVKTLNCRAAAMLEHVNRANSQLGAGKGVMERIEFYVAQWQKVEDQWTHQQLFGDGNSGAKRVDDKVEAIGPDDA